MLTDFQAFLFYAFARIEFWFALFPFSFTKKNLRRKGDSAVSTLRTNRTATPPVRYCLTSYSVPLYFNCSMCRKHTSKQLISNQNGRGSSPLPKLPRNHLQTFLAHRRSRKPRQSHEAPSSSRRLSPHGCLSI